MFKQCPKCNFRVSGDSPREACPKCGTSYEVKKARKKPAKKSRKR